MLTTNDKFRAMKKFFTILIISFLFKGLLVAQPVSLGTLQGNETYFTGFNGKVYFAAESEIMVADTMMKSISLLAVLQEPVLSDANYSITYSRYHRPGSATFIPHFPTAGDYIYFLTKPASDSVTLWRNHKDNNIVEKVGVFDTIPQTVGFNSSLYFYAGKSGYGWQFWKVNDDGSPLALTNLAISNPQYSFLSRDIVAGDQYLYFNMRDTENQQYYLYQTDGSVEGTVLIKNSSGPASYLAYLNGSLFYKYSFSQVWKYADEMHSLAVQSNEEYSITYLTSINNYLIYETSLNQGPESNVYSIEGGTGQPVDLNTDSKYNTFFTVGDKLVYYSEYDRYPNDFFRTDGTLAGTLNFMNMGDQEVTGRFQGVSGYMFYARWFAFGSSDYSNYELIQSDLNDPGVKVSAIFGGPQQYTMANNFAASDDILFFTTADSVFDTTPFPKELFYYVPVSPVITAISKSRHMDWSAYPNPASDHCVIKADASGTLQLMSADGAIIQEDAFNRVKTLDLSKLEPGIYFARLITSDMVLPARKIVKH